MTTALSGPQNKAGKKDAHSCFYKDGVIDHGIEHPILLEEEVALKPSVLNYLITNQSH